MLSVLLFGALLPLQPMVSCGDSTYATSRVRRIVEAAAEAHAQPPETLETFTADFQTEIGLLIRPPEGDEVQAQAEQLAGRVEWRRDGSLFETVTGYRARMVGLSVSSLTYMRKPWVVGPLYGDRVPVAFAEDSAKVGTGPDSTRVRETLVHPFASDRARFYRFSGGDTVLTIQLPGRTVPLVRVRVDPVRIPRGLVVFQGDVDLDATRHQIVRMRGRVLGEPRRRSVMTRLVDVTLQGYYFVDLQNAEYEGSYWLPYRQWIELQVKPRVADDRIVLRVVTELSRTDVNAPVPLDDTTTASGRAPRILHVAPMDSLRGFAGWRDALGTTTADVDATAFDDVLPEGLRPDGPPRLHLGGGSLSDMLRYDRVEGLFTGLGTRLDLRDAAPGGYVTALAGYAWAERTARGRLEVGVRRRRWRTGVSAERRLVSTNDFPRPMGGEPSILGVFGTDDFDYVDRFAVEAHAAVLDESGVSLEVHGGLVRDRAPTMHVDAAPFGGEFRPLRPVQEGDYRHLLLKAALGRGAGAEYVSPGLGIGASWELARGDLDWQRVEGFAQGRTQRGRWMLATSVHAGIVLGDPPPPQTLFELGSYVGRLPGFGYKAFTGDRAAVGAVQLMYALSVLDTPVRLGHLFLPAVAPSPTLEVDTGWTGASTSTLGFMDPLGWHGTEGVRASLFVGIRVVGGAMAIGAARPLGQHGPWRFEWSMEPGT